MSVISSADIYLNAYLSIDPHVTDDILIKYKSHIADFGYMSDNIAPSYMYSYSWINYSELSRIHEYGMSCYAVSPSSVIDDSLVL